MNAAALLILASLAAPPAAGAGAAQDRVTEMVSKSMEQDAEQRVLDDLKREFDALCRKNEEARERHANMELRLGGARQAGPAVVEAEGVRVSRAVVQDGMSYSVDARRALLARVLESICLSAGVRLEVAPSSPKEALEARVNVQIREGALLDVIEAIAGEQGLWVDIDDQRALVGPPAAAISTSMRQGCATRAFRAFHRALLRFPDAPGSARAYRGIAEYFLTMDQPAPAVQALENLVERHGESSEARDAYRLLSVALTRMGRHVEARQALDRHHSRTPADAAAPEAALKLAGELASQGDFAKAVAQYTELVRKWPGAKEAQAALLDKARLCVRMGSYPAALETLEALKAAYGASLGDASAEVEFMTGLCLAQTGRGAESFARLDAFIDKHQKSAFAPGAMLMIADSLVSRKEWSSAAEAYSRFLSSFPRHARELDARAGLASAYRGLGLHAAAADAVSAFLVAQPPHADVDVLVLAAANDHIQAGQATQAIRLLSRVVSPQGSKTWTQAQMFRSKALMYLGQYVEAAGVLEKIRPDLPEGPDRDEASRLLSECYSRAGRLADAALALLEQKSATPPATKEAATDGKPANP